MELMDTLQLYRKRQGLSQVELAEALDVSRQTISKWETGAALPSAENLLALSRLYGVPVDALLNSVEAEAPPPDPAPLLDVLPPAPTFKPDSSLIPRKKLILRMLAAVFVLDLAAFFIDVSVYSLYYTPGTGFVFFSFFFRILGCPAIGLSFAWYDRRWPAKKRISLLIAAAVLFLGLYPNLISNPLLWRLYDLIAWGGYIDTSMNLPPNPLRTFIAWTLCDSYAILSHMLLILSFQLGRLWFSRKKKNCAPQPQAAQQA